MSLLMLAAVGAPSLLPVLAAGGLETILNVADVGTTIAVLGVLIKALWTGTLRRKDEVDSALALVAAADARTAVEALRADREAEARQKIQDAVMQEMTPALIQSRIQGERQVEIQTEMAELQKKLIDTFLSRMARD